MARQKGGARILGPYFQPARRRWHVVVVGAEGGRVDTYFETEREAEEVARAARRRVKAAEELTVAWPRSGAVTAHVVASALGHESETTTFRSYATPASVATGRQRRLIHVLDIVDNDSPRNVVQPLSVGKEDLSGACQPPETA